LVLFNAGLGLYLYSPSGLSLPGQYPEVKQLAETNMSFKELSDYFSSLAYKKGAVYAFEILKRAYIPPNIDIHLLGHIVGDILYKQQGAKGITHCTPDFRNACSHTIVIGTLLEKGPDSFSEIADLCRKAPGGPGAYTMCFHGLGHGVLAYNDYELPQAVKMCEKSGTGNGGEYTECVGGTIMEMIAGVHDREMWKEKSKKYFKDSDPLYPCSASFIPDVAKGLCYTYLTPHLFQAAGSDLRSPTPDEFKKAFTFCEPLTGNSRYACFSGFGKEFVVLGQDRDIRAIDKMTDEQFKKVYDWCSLAKPQDGKDACVISELNSIFWGGENDPLASVRFCALADKEKGNEMCTAALISNVERFISDRASRERICSAMSSTYQEECRTKLLQ
jgi:hypothetical protein